MSSTVSIAAVTSASTGLENSSSRRCLGSEPELTPMRSGVPSSLARATTSADLLRPADVARVDPHAVRAGVDRLDRERVVEVDVGDHRDRRLGDDRPQRVDVLLARHGDAHDVRARLGHAPDLVHRGLQVGRLGLRHRLHGDGRAAADRDAADVDLPGGCHAPECIRRSRGPYAARSAGFTGRLRDRPRAAARPGPRPARRERAPHGATSGSSPLTGVRARHDASSTSAAARSGCAPSSPTSTSPASTSPPRPDYPGPFVQADATERLPFADGQFDLAYSLERDRARPARAPRRVRGRAAPRRPRLVRPDARALLPDRAARAAARSPTGSRRRCAGPTGAWAPQGDWEDIALLGRREMEALFGPAASERVGPLTKSWVCVRPVPGSRCSRR